MRLSKIVPVNQKLNHPKNKIDMKKNNGILLACLFAIIITMSSCEVMGDLVQFGVGIGIFIVIAIIAIIYWISRKFKKIIAAIILGIFHRSILQLYCLGFYIKF